MVLKYVSYLLLSFLVYVYGTLYLMYTESKVYCREGGRGVEGGRRSSWHDCYEESLTVLH